MPHIVVKMYSGKTEAQKQALSDAITKALMTTLNSSEASVSVAIEDVDPARWVEDVYKPEILPRLEALYKKPGYDPLG